MPRLAQRRVILFFCPIRASSWNQISSVVAAQGARGFSIRTYKKSNAVFCKAFRCGISEAAGRYGDLRIRSKSIRRASTLVEIFWFSQPRSVRSFAHSNRRLLAPPYPASIGSIAITQLRSGLELDNLRFWSAGPRSCAPSCWPVRSPRASAASWQRSAPATILPQSSSVPANSGVTLRL